MISPHIQLFAFPYSINPSLYATNFLAHQFSYCLCITHASLVACATTLPQIALPALPHYFYQNKPEQLFSCYCRIHIQCWKAANATARRGRHESPWERILGKSAQGSETSAHVTHTRTHTHTRATGHTPVEAALAGRGQPKRRVEREQSQWQRRKAITSDCATEWL